MSNHIFEEKNLEQLRDVLNVPIITLELDNPSLTFSQTKSTLSEVNSCFIVASTTDREKKIDKIIIFYRIRNLLKNIEKQIKKEYPFSQISTIGIYPSLQYPACVYELNTAADKYVYSNVLPYEKSVSRRILKYLIEKNLGLPPSIGGFGLLVSRG